MLETKNIFKNFGTFTINEINISVKKGDYFVLLGVSGSGKSLLLEMIAGLTKPDTGEIHLDSEDITYQKIQERSVGLVFQDYAVFPHITVRENIAYPLKSKKLKETSIKKRTEELAQQMNIYHLLNRNPGTLSGGELQRVALARTLALNPKVLLLDEPLAALDIQLRSGLRGLLRKLNREGQTILHVTHDYEEAVSLANHVAIIYNGKIIQQGSPKEVFQRPQSEFVANLAGIKNFFRIEIIAEVSNCFKAKINDSVSFYFLEGKGFDNGTILIRGEDVTVSKEKLESTALNNFQGIIKEILPAKFGIDLIIDIGVDVSAHISEKSLEDMNLSEGIKVWISFKASSVKFLGA